MFGAISVPGRLGADGTKPRVRSMSQWIGLPLLAFLCPLCVAVKQKGFQYDDPYILIRYGQHLANGMGWNFNPGVATNNAVSSPLYVLLIAAGSSIGGSPETWSLWIYIVAWGLGGLVLARILFVDGRRFAGWLACALYSVDPLLANARGMESSLYLLLIVGSIWAFQRDRWLVLGCLLALLAMARADAVLLAAALIGWLWLRRRPAVLPVLGPFVAISAAWTAVLWAMTGHLLPSTLAAKIAQRDSGAWGSQFDYLYGLVFNANGITAAERGAGPFLDLLNHLLIFAAVFGTIRAIRCREAALPMLAAAAAINVLEYGVVLRLPWQYTWHYAPWTPWIVAGAAVGITEVAQEITASWR